MMLATKCSSDESARSWVVMVPFPALGHVTPIVKLAQTLHNLHSFRTLVAIPSFIHRRMFPNGVDNGEEEDHIAFADISDGLGDDCSSPDFFAIDAAMENHMPAHLEALIKSLGCGVACVVVDLLASWALDVGRRCGVPVAGFWPAMLSTYRMVSAIPEMMHKGLISESGTPLDQAQIQDVVPLQPILTTRDLPWLVGNKASQNKRFTFWLRTMARSKSLPWLLVNSFSNEDDDNLHHDQVLEQQQQRIFQVAPLTMSIAISHNTSNLTSLWDNEDTSCLDWLATQQRSSVIYASFGSWVGPVCEEKIRETALGLEATGKPFLWVLGDSWRRGLPDGYLGRVAGRGKVVRWAPQVEVLRHEAVACHLTHCGWNSTLESIQNGKYLVCYPISGDQFVNCAYIVSVWKIGVRLSAMERGEVEECVNRSMDMGEEMRRRVSELRETIIGEEGSRKNLQLFVKDLKDISADGGEGETTAVGRFCNASTWRSNLGQHRGGRRDVHCDIA